MPRLSPTGAISGSGARTDRARRPSAPTRSGRRRWPISPHRRSIPAAPRRSGISSPGAGPRAGRHPFPEAGAAMQAHIVLAHPEPRSYNAHLAEVARETLQAEGWGVTLSDLYAMGFDPCERAEHYAERQQPQRFDVQAEQRHASDQQRVPAAVAEEIEKLDRADLLILQYPMWWHLPPAMLKGWYDRVLIYGEVYTSKKRFEHGRFRGKRALLSVTV